MAINDLVKLVFLGIDLVLSFNRTSNLMVVNILFGVGMVHFVFQCLEIAFGYGRWHVAIGVS